METYGPIPIQEKTETKLEKIELIRIPYKGKSLIAANKIFGSNTYSANLASLARREFYNSDEFPKIRFREATIAESIAVIASSLFLPALEFRRNRTTKYLGFNQLGKIVRTREGIFTNTDEVDENALKRLLSGAFEFRGIYLIDDKVAFVPYKSFKTGRQKGREFVEGGLARALEHTSEGIAENLLEITANKNFCRDLSGKTINVEDLGRVKKPVSRTLLLYPEKTTQFNPGIDPDEGVVVTRLGLSGKYDKYSYMGALSGGSIIAILDKKTGD